MRRIHILGGPATRISLVITALWWCSDALAATNRIVSERELVTPLLPIVDLGYVSYRGSFHDDVNASFFHGIPYAFPPIGQLRWRAPVPMDSENRSFSQKAPINASLPGPNCIQGHPAWDFLDRNDGNPPPVAGSESCLTVDIVTPSGAFKDGQVFQKLPVVIKIHGGGYTMGGSDWMNANYLLPHSKDSIVFVAIQYRLGALGFLGGEAMRAQDGVANAGLLDQRAAIEWVKRHINKFGGDPQKMTIWGGSAGGGSVTAQMMMYGGVANPPFRNAIGEYPWWQPYHGEKILNAQYRQLLSFAGCNDLNCLRHVPETIMGRSMQDSYLTGYHAGLYGFGDFYYGPSVDGNVLLGLPSEEFAAGRFTNIPVLATRDRYEGYTFSNLSTSNFNQLITDLHDLLPGADDSFVSKLLKLYPETEYNNTFFRREALFGDMFVNCPSTWLLEGVKTKGQGSFKLIFNAGNQKHAATDAFLFGNAQNETIASNMRDWFLSFAIHSSPNTQSWTGYSPPTKPNWPVYGNSGRQVLVINERDIITAKDYDVGERCEFWHQNSAVTRNRVVIQDGPGDSVSVKIIQDS